MGMRFRKVLNAYSSIITKNISLFLAAGVINILYASGGWFPNRAMESFATILYRIIIPEFLAYYAGQKAAQSIGQPVRSNLGGITGVLAVGCMLSQQWGVSFFLVVAAAAAAGYVSAWIYERVERYFPSGFEMMGRNLMIVVVGLCSGVCFCRLLLPVVGEASDRLMPVLGAAFASRFLFLASVVIEPLKVLFLNNSLNHGILIPLGMNQMLEAGRSVLFLIETNPGPGLGVLAAYWLSKKEERGATAAVMAVEFVGGIHEVYFPYVLSNLKLLAAVTAGGICGTFCFTWLDAGLVGAVSPGSILTILMMAPLAQWWRVLLGIAVSAVVSGVVAAVVFRADDAARAQKMEPDDAAREQKVEPDDAARAQKVEPDDAAREEAQPEASDASQPESEPEGQEEAMDVEEEEKRIFPQAITAIYVVCDAGLGSSAMGAALLRRQLKAEGITDITVRAAAADDIPEGGSLLVCQKDFYEQRLKAQEQELPFIYTVDQLAGKGIYDELAARIGETRQEGRA